MGVTWTIGLLGGFRVSIDGMDIGRAAWQGRRGADLVKFLAISPGHRAHREKVMAALWPELGSEAAGANLRKAVHYARRALGSESAVLSQAATLQLLPDTRVIVDSEAFEVAADEALRSGRRTDCHLAAQLYAGELLPSDIYEAWSDEPRKRLNDRFAALLRVTEDWARLARLDPLDELAARSLMQLSLDSGDRIAAVRQFERLRECLREELGVSPEAATVAVLQAALLLDGPDSPSPRERAQALLAQGLVAWNREELGETERVARQARTIALDHDLGRELGEASTLLAMVADAGGTWQELFVKEFTDLVASGSTLQRVVYDAHVCFSEYHLAETESPEVMSSFGRELLAIAQGGGSAAGEAVARLVLGEVALQAGELDDAVDQLTQAVALNVAEKCTSGECLAVQRLAEAELASSRGDNAVRLLRRARALAQGADLESHLLVRVLATTVAASQRGSRLDVLGEAVSALAAIDVCDPCSIGFRLVATQASAAAGDLDGARRHLREGERVSAMWRGGPWAASVWEARASLRLAEGDPSQAGALLREAADEFQALRRPLDAQRCLVAAEALS